MLFHAEPYLPGTDAALSDISSTLYVLLSTLSHQLQAIDDIEFQQEARTLSPSDFAVVIDLLKGILYRGYWTQPILDHDPSSTNGDPLQQLYLSQVLWIATKVYNQLSARNERLNFVPDRLWLWEGLSSADVEVRGWLTNSGGLTSALGYRWRRYWWFLVS